MILRQPNCFQFFDRPEYQKPRPYPRYCPQKSDSEMKTISLNPWACSFFFLPIALPSDRGAMEDCWRVGDNPRSSLFSFAFLNSIFCCLMLNVFPLKSAFSEMCRKTAITYIYLLSIPSFSLQNRNFCWLPHLQFFVQRKSVAVFTF